MRRLVAQMAAFAFAAVFLQAPWSHVHVDGHDADHHQHHAGLDALHGHGLDPVAAGRGWRSQESDDARSLAPGTAIRGAEFCPDLTFTRADPVLLLARAVTSRVVDLAPRAHGPPTLGCLSPRAPPALPLSA